MDTVHRVAELDTTERLHFYPSNKIMKAICYLTEHGHMKYASFTIFIIWINHDFNKLLYYSYQFPRITEVQKYRRNFRIFAQTVYRVSQSNRVILRLRVIFTLKKSLFMDFFEIAFSVFNSFL